MSQRTVRRVDIILPSKDFLYLFFSHGSSMANMADADAISFESYVLVFKRLGDNTTLYVLGDPDENELMLVSVLTAMEESVGRQKKSRPWYRLR